MASLHTTYTASFEGSQVCLRAAVDFERGDVLFNEKPLVVGFSVAADLAASSALDPVVQELAQQHDIDIDADILQPLGALSPQVDSEAFFQLCSWSAALDGESLTQRSARRKILAQLAVSAMKTKLCCVHRRPCDLLPRVLCFHI
jgi:hypothetical protein